MPPKVRITEEMIVDAAVRLVREQGPNKITAQAVAARLGCSTQPIMSHFKKVEDLRRAAAEKADAFHTAFLMEVGGENPMLEIGLNNIRFAREEQNLFRFLFQSGAFSGISLWDSLEGDEIQPLLEVFSRESGLSMPDTRQVFRSLFLAVHGYASMFANNDMNYEETEIISDLTLIFEGAVCSLKEKEAHV